MAEQQWTALLDRNATTAKTWHAMPTIDDMKTMMKSNPGAGLTIVITCADPRADPTHYLNLGQGEIPIIRNAGGRVTEDVLTSLELMSAVGKINMLIVIHHTECGGLYLTEDIIRKDLSERNPEHARSIAHKEWHSFRDIGMDQSIRDDLAKLNSWPFLLKGTPVRGYAFDIKSGELREVMAAQ